MAQKEREPAVFQIVRESACGECGAELWPGELLKKEGEGVLCLGCAGLADLEFLGAGDTAMTRRATAHSSRRLLVLRWSRSRKQYERQGILVEPAAIARAEQECAADAPERAAARQKAEARRVEDDNHFTAEVAEAIRRVFPGCPPAEVEEIARHTSRRGSGRIGRSAEGRALSENALTLAVRAAIRHRHTQYEELLGQGWDRADARARVEGRVDEIAANWRVRH